MKDRLTSIDALRGLAALWVFVYHVWNVFAPGYSPQGTPAEHKPLNANTPTAILVTYPILAHGYTGVGLFFVISGFCIHLPQARRHARTGADQLELRPFYYRRLQRLYPAYFASLFLSAFGLWAMSNTMHGFEPVQPVVLTVYVLVNGFFLLALRPDAMNINGVYWTLWYEVQFYLAYPLLLKACRKFGFWTLAVVLLVVELAFTLIPTPDVLKGIAPHFEWFFLRRLFEWFLGMLLAERVANGEAIGRPLAAVIGLAGFVIGVVLSRTYSDPTATYQPLWSLHELFLAIGAFGLVAFVVSPRPEPTRGTLRHRVRSAFAFCGDWSYSLYLIHMPLMRLIFAVEGCLSVGMRSKLTFALAGVVSLLLVPATAYLWYRLFEKPFMPKAKEPTPEPVAATPVDESPPNDADNSNRTPQLSTSVG